jgi:hypothetical protein
MFIVELALPNLYHAMFYLGVYPKQMAVSCTRPRCGPDNHTSKSLDKTGISSTHAERHTATTVLISHNDASEQVTKLKVKHVFVWVLEARLNL